MTTQLWIFIFLCLILCIFEYLNDRSKKTIRSIILLNTVVVLMVLAATLPGNYALIPIVIMVLIVIGYIINLWRKKKSF